MSSALNKRQQARNERTLQELIKTVPGNDRCADCGARNPGWASWSLGTFLCMRCAALHRKIGTHISKVKSLSMDSWNNEQVDNMKRIGNAASNQHYNPHNAKPAIPIDVDEVDGAMERFIRQKYEYKTFTSDSRPGTRHNTGSTSSDDRPPPLPPKPTKRFGFGLRATSSTFPMSRNDTLSPPVSPGLSGFGRDSPPRINKPSRVFGSTVSSASDSFETKLATLRDMGFPDDRRNATILKGLNGNLDKAVEALIRLGEGGGGTSRTHTPVSGQQGAVNGITIEKVKTPTSPVSPNNPFQTDDFSQPRQQPALPAAQVPRATVGPVTQSHPTSPTNPFNPFLPPTQSIQQPQSSLDQAFQSLQIYHQQPTQQLFPNSTGGYAEQQQSHNPFQQSFTPPPVSQVAPQFSSFQSQAPIYPQQQYQTPTSGQASNPFLRSSKSQIFTPTNPFNSSSPAPTVFGAFQHPQVYPQQQQQIPFGQPQTQMLQQTPLGQPQTQTHSEQSLRPQGIQQQLGRQFGTQNVDISTFGFAQPQQHTPFTTQPQFPIRQDKASILALYSYPQLAPKPPAAMTAPSTPASGSTPSITASTSSLEPPIPTIKHRSVTMPVSLSSAGTIPQPQPPAPNNLNPFASSPGVPQPSSINGSGIGVGSGTRHVSQESVDFAGLMGGRHSPDAFAGLSARFIR